MERISSFVGRYISPMSIPRITWTDIVEILIISFLVYHILVWIKNTKAWSLLRGLIVIGVFIFLAYVFRMNTILWIVKNASVVAITAMIVVFQPELRKALDMLGRKNIFSSLIPFDSNRNLDERFSDKTVGEIVKACYEMGKVKTGALIVIAQNDPLTEYERTGIELDSLVSSQLLINIFEHNTPLHDGAIIIQGNRVVSATCYLPLIIWRLARNWERDIVPVLVFPKLRILLRLLCRRRQEGSPLPMKANYIEILMPIS